PATVPVPLAIAAFLHLSRLFEVAATNLPNSFAIVRLHLVGSAEAWDAVPSTTSVATAAIVAADLRYVGRMDGPPCDGGSAPRVRLPFALTRTPVGGSAFGAGGQRPGRCPRTSRERHVRDAWMRRQDRQLWSCVRAAAAPRGVGSGQIRRCPDARSISRPRRV